MIIETTINQNALAIVGNIETPANDRELCWTVSTAQVHCPQNTVQC